MITPLHYTPCITALPDNYRALWELALGDVWCPTSLSEWRERIDTPKENCDTQTLFVNLSASEREELANVFGFPSVALPPLPSIDAVNEELPTRFESSNLLKQSEVAAEITKRVRHELPQIAVLLVFDGLSFYETTDWEFPNAVLEPCLVDGLSVTEKAMRRLIGSPVLTHRLFELDYFRRMGFAYWERSTNALTDALFTEFPATQLHRVTAFEEVLETIRALPWPTHTYVQIIRSGLDGVCHRHRERPDVSALLENLKRDITLLLEVLQETGHSFRLFITADHGILWDNNQSVVPLTQETSRARYTDGSVASAQPVLTLRNQEGTYTVLTGDKVIAKKRNVMEWGFHGGFSAQESLVPFWDIRRKFSA